MHISIIVFLLGCFCITSVYSHCNEECIKQYLAEEKKDPTVDEVALFLEQFLRMFSSPLGSLNNQCHLVTDLRHLYDNTCPSADIIEKYPSPIKYSVISVFFDEKMRQYYLNHESNNGLSKMIERCITVVYMIVEGIFLCFVCFILFSSIIYLFLNLE